MSEVERIFRSFSDAERELWEALYGPFPVELHSQQQPDWLPVARMRHRSDPLGDPNRRYYPELERYVRSKQLEADKRKRTAA